MATGIVKKWLDDRGFGFLTPDDGGETIFVHHSGIVAEGRKHLIEGQRVEFTITEDEQGRPKAVDVVIVPAG